MDDGKVLLSSFSSRVSGNEMVDGGITASICGGGGGGVNGGDRASIDGVFP